MPDSTPPRVETRGLSALAGQLGGARRAFVVTGPSRRHLGELSRWLDGVALEVFAGARRHVPAELVDQAEAAFAASGAGVLVALGGGAATGLAKALRLRRDFRFIAVPTTYAGSEITNVYGIRSASGKATGRDARVVPDCVVYDESLTLDMPVVLSVTSLMNALAHPISALSTGSLDPGWRARALEAAGLAHAAIVAVVEAPRSLPARRQALAGALAAARILSACPLGAHHHLAHEIGGRFDLDHAALHAVLLPHSVANMARERPELEAALGRAMGVQHPARELFGLLSRAGAPTSLRELGASDDGLQALLAGLPDGPARTLRAAIGGERP